MANFNGTIIVESLSDKEVLEKVKITATKTEKVTEKHKTSWLTKWTVYSVQITPEKAAKVAKELSESLESAHNWYADFKNDNFHFIVFRNKVFRVERNSKAQYDQAKKYGIGQGIPEYQLDFK